MSFEDPAIIFNIVRVFSVATIAFVVAMAGAPFFIKLLRKYKIGKQIRQDGDTPIFTAMHKNKTGTLTMGGLLVWVTVVFLAIIFWQISRFDGVILNSLNFFSREQTWLPIGALVISGIIGAFDDFLNIKKIGPKGGGLRIKHRLLFYSTVAIGGAWWFYHKLGWNSIHIPGLGDFDLGVWYIPLFIFIIIATAFSVNETDGLDGLAGGTLMVAFAAYGVIAFSQGKFEMAMFCGAICGALMAFLWFNVYPAKFFMGDTGAMALGTTLGVIAMLTNSVLVLPLIGFILVIESLSVIIQLTSKKLRNGKKIFLSSPIHHHFEAKGWPETQVTMRFWMISGIMATIGLVIGLVGGG